jgi:hypothetical protein
VVVGVVRKYSHASSRGKQWPANNSLPSSTLITSMFHARGCFSPS